VPTEKAVVVVEGVAAAVNNERGAPHRTALVSGGKQSRTWVKTVLRKLNIS